MTSKSELILRRLTKADENSFLEAIAAWDSHPDFLFAPGYKAGLRFEDYVDLLDAQERGENLPEGYVPMSALCGFIGDALVGRVNFRHRLTERLSRVGGHIGYGVLPAFRRQGIAKEMLRQTFPYAQAIGLERVLLTCNDANPGSARTIEACGGILENKFELKPGALERRYWIQLPPLKK